MEGQSSLFMLIDITIFSGLFGNEDKDRDRRRKKRRRKCREKESSSDYEGWGGKGKDVKGLATSRTEFIEATFLFGFVS
ncbi:hypothetical protein COLO4_14851 [Corchorus olitorius]|uniref:Uncharacterized protein n=1 Tax=Corchorus olitorius TaxID=93759 RepID=A0A1R3JQH2_9ROSI|nr:hypothetical protein COLO4_14851 [Corchorus olitorius]